MVDVSKVADVVIAVAAVATFVATSIRAIRKDSAERERRAERRGAASANEAARLRRIEEALGLPPGDDDEAS